MTEEIMALVPTIVDAAADFTVIATSPEQMQAAQKSLILWAARKIQEIKVEFAEAREQYDLCVKNKWRPSAWRAQMTKHEKRSEFYRKIKAALEAGYYIVPPFPIDIFAIRTKVGHGPQPMRGRHPNNHDQKSVALPLGQGTYVDPRPNIYGAEVIERQKDGTDRRVMEYYAGGWKGVDFPFKLAKAEIREATDRALKSGIFDELGVMPRTRSPDPIVCGHIFDPTSPSYSYHSNDSRRHVTFFVAWWLDTKTL